MLNRIRFVFYDNINVKENVFLFSERDQERDTLTISALSGLLETKANESIRLQD